MVAQSRQGAETRLKIVQAAADVFHKQGVGTTSQTRLGHFYHYFQSKNGLVHEVLPFYAAAIRSGAPPVGYEIQSWEDLERWFSAQVQLQQRFRMTRGCPWRDW